MSGRPRYWPRWPRAATRRSARAAAVRDAAVAAAEKQYIDACRARSHAWRQHEHYLATLHAAKERLEKAQERSGRVAKTSATALAVAEKQCQDARAAVNAAWYAIQYYDAAVHAADERVDIARAHQAFSRH